MPSGEPGHVKLKYINHLVLAMGKEKGWIGRNVGMKAKKKDGVVKVMYSHYSTLFHLIFLLLQPPCLLPSAATPTDFGLSCHITRGPFN